MRMYRLASGGGANKLICTSRKMFKCIITSVHSVWNVWNEFRKQFPKYCNRVPCDDMFVGGSGGDGGGGNHC